MKKQLLAAVLLVCSLVSITACKKKKDDPNNVTTTSDMNNAKDFVEKYGAQKQTFNFNTSELPKTFTLAGGTQITLQPGSLTIAGVPVTGALTLEAYEVLKRSTAIFTGTNTNHVTGAPLISDGFFYLNIKQNETSVDEMMSLPYNVKMQTEREGEWTDIWIGDVNEQNQMIWQPPMNGGGDSVKALDSVFNFSLRELGWVNCDVFYEYNNPKTTITVTTLNNPGAMATYLGGTGETFVLFCAQGENVVAQLYTPAGINTVKSYDETMPIGVTGRLFAFSIKDGKCYLAKQDVTISANMMSTLSLAEVTEEVLADEIEALDSY